MEIHLSCWHQSIHLFGYGKTCNNTLYIKMTLLNIESFLKDEVLTKFFSGATQAKWQVALIFPALTLCSPWSFL